MLLAIAAGVQFNDPDPVFWVGLYLLSAVAPLLYAFKVKLRYGHIVNGLAALFCVAGLVCTVSGGIEYLQHVREESLIQGMSPDKPYIEETRELIGALVGLGVVGVYWYLGVRRNRGSVD